MAVSQLSTPGACHNATQRFNLYFKSVVDMIPSDAYFTKPTDSGKRHKKDKNAEDKIPASQVKALVKRRKLNPNLMKSTSQMMEIESSDEEEIAPMKVRKKVAPSQTPSSISDLQKKLQERIDDIKSQRQAKNRSEEEQEAIRVKRKQERKRYKEKKKQKQVKLSQKPEPRTSLEKPIKNKEEKIKKNVTDKNGKVVFSKFDFGQSDVKSKKLKKKKDIPTGKNYEALLKKVNEKQEIMEKLKSEDPSKASELVVKEGWSKAMAKAEGIKLKDDPGLLKKSIKRKQSIKNQSAKKWKERDDKVKEKMDKRQDRRNRNIEIKKNRKKNFQKGRKPGF